MKICLKTKNKGLKAQKNNQQKLKNKSINSAFNQKDLQILMS